MSAYIVSPEQIQTIVTWAQRNQSLPYNSTPEEIAKVLAEANIASVEYRYKDLIGSSVKAFLACLPTRSTSRSASGSSPACCRPPSA